jgi:site-specific DNA-methyltransferase (adenine-specific)
MIELLNVDCMEYMKGLPDKDFDLAIVDPPYGNDSDATKTFTSNSINRATKRKVYKQFTNNVPDKNYFIELKRVSKNQIIWGGNFFGLIGGAVVWNKNGTAFGEGEIAICSTHNSVRFFEYTWNGMLQGDMKNKEVRIHQNQKPIALYKWLLKNYAKSGDKILDTHGGSMSIAIACHEMGFDLTLCEIDKDYYEAGVKRVHDAMKQQKLFYYAQ